MRNSNGQSMYLDLSPDHKTDNTQNVLKVNRQLLPSQAELIDMIMFEGATELSKSLKLIHDLALYHSDVGINEVEKSALFSLKILMENFERIAREV